ncbi:MAG: hypothetical protein IT244_04420 [Bacteroidia bacterium]|nr:hypothetical protein [Bacteroidia bacterium]
MLEDKFTHVDIADKFYYFKDSTDKIKIQDIATGKCDHLFKKHTKKLANFGNLQTTFWTKIVVYNKSSKNTDWLLLIDNHHLDTIVLYTQDSDGKYTESRTGRLTPYNKRDIKFNTFAFQLNLTEADSQVFYVKISSYLFVYPISVVRQDTFSEMNMERGVFQGILVGFFTLILLYNLVIYFTDGDRNYLFYLFYVFMNIIKICDLKGFMDYFWQGPLSFMATQTPGITVINAYILMLFSSNMLDFKHRLPIANKILLFVFVPLSFASLSFNIAGIKLYSSQINQVGSLALLVFLYVCGIVVFLRGYKAAKFYVIAVSTYMASIIIYIGSLMGVITMNYFTDNIPEIGTGLEMLLFSFALADKISAYKKQKVKAEKELLKSLQANELLIKDQNKLLEIKVEERTHDLMLEKQKSDDLLLNILPEEVAQELKDKGESEARLFENTTVIFTDFVNFTGISERLSPKELVKEIHHCFTAFDHIVEKHGLEKIKTIGDAYLAVGGVPVADNENAYRCVKAAIDIREFIADYCSKGGVFEIRIGLHSGPLVAGIVGVKKFAFDIWGDTVNTAARMEQKSETGKINISGKTFELVKHHFNCVYRGKIPAKNKGEVDMYFVENELSPQ